LRVGGRGVSCSVGEWQKRGQGTRTNKNEKNAEGKKTSS